jgi:hypothetical protein
MAASVPADKPRTEAARTEPPPSDAVQIAMLLLAAAPVVGAVCSAPVVGFTLAGLALGDSILILLGVNY